MSYIYLPKQIPVKITANDDLRFFKEKVGLLEVKGGARKAFFNKALEVGAILEHIGLLELMLAMINRQAGSESNLATLKQREEAIIHELEKLISIVKDKEKENE